jgi:hypothetical protein
VNEENYTKITYDTTLHFASVVHPILRFVFPACSIQEIAQAMINATTVGYENSILEVTDIKKLAAH